MEKKAVEILQNTIPMIEKIEETVEGEMAERLHKIKRRVQSAISVLLGYGEYNEGEEVATNADKEAAKGK